MSLVAELSARARGDEICSVLSLRGYRPLWFKTEALGDRIILCLEVMPRWRKGIVLSADDTPNTAEHAFRDWKAAMMDDLDAGQPSQTVREAIAHFGETDVRKALG